MKPILMLLAVLSLAQAVAVPAAEFHVAPGGKDANPGTPKKPFATLLRARDAARAAGGTNSIFLAAGRYFNDGAIVLDDRDSGLTVRGEKPGAVAEIYGGVPVAGWEKWKGDIWRAPVPKGKRFFTLIVDGQPATMAQTPNSGSGFGGGARRIGNDAVVVPEAWRGYDYSDAQVFAFIGGDWFAEMREVLDATADTGGRLKVDPGQAMQFGGMNGRFFLRGVLEFLDEPGEWCLKHKEGYVYYWPKRGTPADHLIVRPTSERLFDIHGRTPQTPAKGIALANLALIGSDFCARWYLFAPGQDGSTPEPLQQGLVFGENVDGLKVSGCKILAAGHSGVWLNKFARNCVVERCLITGAGFAGVYANGFMPGEGPFTSGLESYVNKGHRIENNFIYDCGKFVGGGCGIQFYQAGDSLITRNEIGQMPRYGISYKGIRRGCIPKNMYGHEVTFDTHFDYLHTRNLKVIGNEIYSVCRNSFDYGGIESWGPGRDNLWESNDLHDLDQTLAWDGWAHVLFSDDACHWLAIRGNIIHHCHGGRLTGAFMLKSIEETIEDNIVVDCRIGRLITFEPFMEPSWNVTIRRNIFAVDGVTWRYGNLNEYTFKGKSYLDAIVPPGAAGFREVNHNFITPANPADPNPLAVHKMDIDSVFASNLVTCVAPDWDATRLDYRIRPLPGMEFNTNTLAEMGLRKDFPFDTLAATRRRATDKIQAEDYQRMNALRTQAGTGIYNMSDGSWSKYANIEFPTGLTKAVFALTGEPPGATGKPFIRRYGDTVVEALPFKGDTSVETVTQWEITTPHTKPGKTGPELLDEVFPPEKDIKAGEWKPYLAPVTSRAGITSAPGVVDLDTANGEGVANACAYARCSIYAYQGRSNATMTFETGQGGKVWLNGELIITANHPGIYSETKKGIIKQGWNTILVKVNQGAKPGDFWFKFGTVASACGDIVALPGLPTDEHAEHARAQNIVELRLDSPKGELIGALPAGQAECPVKPITGNHNVFLVFHGNNTKLVDWFRFE